MRYTTIIDITEYPVIYRNINARLIYLHLALRSGYHEQDRDLIDISIRGIAASVGVSISATRHALGQLQKAGLIARQGENWKVTKYVMQETPGKRPQTKREQQLEIERLKRQEEQARKDAQDSEKARIKAQWTQAIAAASSKFGKVVEGLQAGAVGVHERSFVVIARTPQAAALMEDENFRKFLRPYIDNEYRIYTRIIQ